MILLVCPRRVGYDLNQTKNGFDIFTPWKLGLDQESIGQPVCQSTNHWNQLVNDDCPIKNNKGKNTASKTGLGHQNSATSRQKWIE